MHVKTGDKDGTAPVYHRLTVPNKLFSIPHRYQQHHMLTVGN